MVNTVNTVNTGNIVDQMAFIGPMVNDNNKHWYWSIRHCEHSSCRNWSRETVLLVRTVAAAGKVRTVQLEKTSHREYKRWKKVSVKIFCRFKRLLNNYRRFGNSTE
jgi:hypothetical protein